VRTRNATLRITISKHMTMQRRTAGAGEGRGERSRKGPLKKRVLVFFVSRWLAFHFTCASSPRLSSSLFLSSLSFPLCCSTRLSSGQILDPCLTVTQGKNSWNDQGQPTLHETDLASDSGRIRLVLEPASSTWPLLGRETGLPCGNRTTRAGSVNMDAPRTMGCRWDLFSTKSTLSV
jgi:hypothetical protein